MSIVRRSLNPAFLPLSDIFGRSKRNSAGWGEMPADVRQLEARKLRIKSATRLHLS